ncbi:MAG: SDR family NAD(P)-dependent oxidoreductase [Halanaeroarchaeum sp.]
MTDEDTDPTTFSLDGRTAVVTGGTRGIGKAISLGLAEAGADVVPVSRTRTDVESAVQAVRDRGADSIVETLDVTDEDEIRTVLSRTAAELGGIDVVVNNAGVNPDGALGRPEDVDSSSFEFVVDVNLEGAFTTAAVAGEWLTDSRAGSLINVASVGGLVGLPRQHPYVASKHGMVGMTKSMALDWAPDVRVNAIAPGYVATELTEELYENESLRSSIEDRTPMDRWAEPSEIAAPAVFLASDAASYVTGTVLTVDGGWTAR